jgi:hypothetical protein
VENIGRFYGQMVYVFYGYLFCGYLVCFVAIWYVLWPFGIFYGYLVYFFPVLVCCATKNLATVVVSNPI